MKNLKRILAAGALACALTVGHGSAAVLTVAGTPMPASMQTMLINDRTYVPLRTVAGQLAPGVQVDWSGGVASVSSEGLRLTARVGARWLEANGRCFYVEDGVRLVDGSVMVPVRVLAAAMDGRVDWDAQTGSVEVTPGTGVPTAPPYSQEELDWLARIISAESQGEPLEGKLAVGTVVLNRVASEEFPDTIYGVIFDSKWGTQFTPVANGTIYNEPTAESIAAAKLCLEGVKVAGESLYFLDPAKSTNLWTMDHRTFVTTIGCHWFYA